MEISWKWGDQFFTWGVFLEGNGTELVDSWSLELEWHNEVPHCPILAVDRRAYFFHCYCLGKIKGIRAAWFGHVWNPFVII